CCAGRPSKVWGSVYLPNHYGVWEKRIPTQCLEGIWAALLLLFAIRVWHSLPFSGALFLLVAAGYGAGRLVMEFAREQSTGSSRLTIDHLFSVLMIVLSLAVLSANWPK